MSGAQAELFDFPAAPPPVRAPRAALAKSTDRPRGRRDNELVAGELEVLWPPCIRHLSEEDKVLHFGDIPRNTRLTVQQVCRRLNCDSNTVYRYIDTGVLRAINIAPPTSTQPTYRIYRWSLIEHIYRHIEGGLVSTTQTQGGSKPW